MKVKQAVILAAGRGTRLWPITVTKPKPLVMVANKSILEHLLDALSGLIEEVILVIGEGGQMIKDSLGESYGRLNIRYVWQNNPQGTADALLRTKDFLEDNFLVFYGDTIQTREDIESCLSKFPSLSVIEVDNPSAFGIIVPEGDRVKKIVEKPKEFIGNLASSGIMFLPKYILEKKIEKSARGEYEIPAYLDLLVKENNLYFARAERMLQVSYPWELLDLNSFMLEKESKKVGGVIEPNCHIEGTLILGKGSVLKSGTYIEGPVIIGDNCKIGPNCYIRKFTAIGNGCRVGQSVEIKNSIVGNKSKVPHLSYVGDSVIGENCNLGAGTIAANLRFDGDTIKTKVKGETVDSKRGKLGCTLGDNVKTGVNVSFMPGVMIGANSVVYPNLTVSKNLPDDTIFKE